MGVEVAWQARTVMSRLDLIDHVEPVELCMYAGWHVSVLALQSERSLAIEYPLLRSIRPTCRPGRNDTYTHRHSIQKSPHGTVRSIPISRSGPFYSSIATSPSPPPAFFSLCTFNPFIFRPCILPRSCLGK